MESIHHYTKKSAEAKDLFLGILSHDLRNPLGSIAMSARACFENWHAN